jgi:hypothetical protein
MKAPKTGGAATAFAGGLDARSLLVVGDNVYSALRTGVARTARSGGSTSMLTSTAPAHEMVADSTYLYFESWDGSATGPASIVRMPLAGGAATHLFRLTSVNDAHLAIDREQLYFTDELDPNERRPRIMRQLNDGSETAVALYTPPKTAAGSGMSRILQDEQWIYFSLGPKLFKVLKQPKSSP